MEEAMNKKLALYFTVVVLCLSMVSCQLPWGKETTPSTKPTTTDSEEPVATKTETLVPPVTPSETATPTVTPTEPSPLPVFVSPEIYHIHMFTPLQGWALTRYGDDLLHTADGGATWLDATPAELRPIPSGYTYLNLQPFFLDENHAWFTPHSEGVLYRTQDGGVTWTTISLPFDNAIYFFLDSLVGYGTVDLGAGAGSHYLAIYRTLDAGVTWTQVFTHEPGESKSLPEGGSKSRMTFLDINHGWVGGNYPREDYFYLHTTEDGGTTWARETDITLPGMYVGSGLEVREPFFVSSASGYLPVRALAPDDHDYLLIYRSDDSGQTWAFQNSVMEGRDVDFVSVDEGWVAAEMELFHTLDGGLNWSSIALSGIGVGEFLLKVDFVDSLHGWLVATPDDSTWTPLKLYRTTDGGATWIQLLP
jgi:photosystem II stability/assembly factor-like uncharacterized protein